MITDQDVKVILYPDHQESLIERDCASSLSSDPPIRAGNSESESKYNTDWRGWKKSLSPWETSTKLPSTHLKDESR